MKGFNPPRPMQAECRMCTRLFAYFQTTKRRQFCSPCWEIKVRLEMVLNNDHQRRLRHMARDNARAAHGEAA